MKIALVQAVCKLGDVGGNVAMMERAIASAAGDGADLVVFPEMCDTGYDMATIKRCAQPGDGMPRVRLSRAARRANAHVVAGLSLREPDGRIFNTAVAFDRSGKVTGEYRKIHLFNGEPINESACFISGDRRVLVAMDGIVVGLMICYDLRFPELSRSLMLDGAEALVLVAAWPAQRIAHWRALSVARAMENLSLLVAVNRAGTDANVQMGGGSIAVGPTGEVLLECVSGHSLIAADAQIGMFAIETQAIAEARRRFPWLQDRQTQSYRL